MNVACLFKARFPPEGPARGELRTTSGPRVGACPSLRRSESEPNTQAAGLEGFSRGLFPVYHY